MPRIGDVLLRGRRPVENERTQTRLQAVERKVEEVERDDGERDRRVLDLLLLTGVPVAEAPQRVEQSGNRARVRDDERRENDEEGGSDDERTTAVPGRGRVAEGADDRLDEQTTERTSEPDQRRALLRQAQGEQVRSPESGNGPSESPNACRKQAHAISTVQVSCAPASPIVSPISCQVESHPSRPCACTPSPSSSSSSLAAPPPRPPMLP